MPEVITFVLTWAGGVALGGLFFGGLWWTVRRGMTSGRPALLFLGSALLRMSMAMVGLYLLTDSRWERILLALLGFVMARWAVSRLTRDASPRPPRAGGEPWT